MRPDSGVVDDAGGVGADGSGALVVEACLDAAELGGERVVDEAVADAELDAPEHGGLGVGVEDDILAELAGAVSRKADLEVFVELGSAV
jgi:hypothetical protein